MTISRNHPPKTEAPAAKPDTTNRWLVTIGQEPNQVTIINRTMLAARFLSRAEALSLAAWLVAIADPGRQNFDPLLKAILET